MSNYAVALPQKEQNPFGTHTGSDAVTYSIAKVSSGQQVTGAKFREVETWVNAERTRRANAGGAPSNRFTGLIEAADLNFLKTQTELNPSAPAHASWQRQGPGGTVERPQLLTLYFTPATAYYGDFFGVDKDTVIDSTELNSMIDKVINAGKACICNCDYCTCNCDYCTCNCNYSCTCDCNYSDERLKENIEFVKEFDGLNLYSYSYIWDKTIKYIGILAQELIGTKYESALHKDKNGFYFVDYAKLPVNMVKA